MTSLADRQQAIGLIDEARASGARLNPACKELGITARTYQRWKKDDAVNQDRRPHAVRPTPSNALTGEEIQQILDACHRPEFVDLPPAKIVAQLLDEEDRYIASESSFYRVLRTRGEQQHRGRAKAPGKQAKPTSYRAEAPCQVWSWDCTWLPGSARGTFFYLFMILDIFSRKIVGWEVAESESAAEAASVLQKAVLAEGCVNTPLVLHSDNGSPMKGATLLETLRRLQIQPSFSRPRVSNDNPYSEALFRTCKYVPGFPRRGFFDVHEARQWAHTFVHWYNFQHKHSALKYVTSDQRHRGSERPVLENRQAIYQKARAETPSRWSRNTRDWRPVGSVWLNPERREIHERPSEAAA